MSTTPSTPDDPPLLERLRVLEFLPQPAALGTRLLADMGARVITVTPPHFEVPTGHAYLSYLYENAGKSKVVLDMYQAGERTRLLELVKGVDVVVEAFTPGCLKTLDLGYESLIRVNPRLIMVSVTPYGQIGPFACRPADNLALAAAGGQMATTGDTDSPPLKLAGRQSYYTAALYTANAVLLALRRALQSGGGCHIDISIQECMLSTLEHLLPVLLFGGDFPTRQGSVNPVTGNCILPCRDGWIHVNLHQRFDNLVGWMRSDDMAGELEGALWQKESHRRRHFDRLTAIVSRWSRSYAKADLMQTAQLMQFPWAAVQSPSEILTCPQLGARRFFKTVDQVPAVPGMPFTINDRRPRPRRGVAGMTGEIAQPMRPADHSRAAPPDTMNGTILAAIRILDFSRILAGPFATRLLADFGAEVIKVQSRPMATGAERNETPYFRTWNRNKRSITLNLNHPRAREAVLALTERCDVVVENYAPRVMANWDLTYDRLKEVNPRLVMLSMSAAGQDGPFRNHVAYGQTVQSLGGLNGLTAFSASHPLGAGYAHADVVSGLYASLAILAALDARDRYGQGAYIDLSEYEAVCTLVGPALMAEAVHPGSGSPCGNSDDASLVAPQGCYPCRGGDRWCTLAVTTLRQWRELCRLMGATDRTLEASTATLGGRLRHREEIDACIGAWTITLAPEESVRRLQQAGIPSAVVNRPRDLVTDPQLAATGFFGPLDPAAPAGPLVDANPIRIQGGATAPQRPAPGLGKDNHYVFREVLGWTDAELEEMIREKVVY